MPRSDVRDAMRRRRVELRAMLPRFRQLARDRLARLEQIPAFKAAREAIAKRRQLRRRRTLATVALLLLLLLFVDCAGKPGGKAVLAKATPIVKVTPSPKPKPTVLGPLKAKLDPQKRPGYNLDARPGPDWLDDFRLQVAARSPRLAACFNGSDRGGRLRWTVLVDSKTGVVSDHDFEPLGGGANMRNEQKACAIRALSDPAYLLVDPPPDALPNRISLVLEY